MGTVCELCETGLLLPRGGWHVCSNHKCGAWFNTHSHRAYDRSDFHPIDWPEPA